MTMHAMGKLAALALCVAVSAPAGAALYQCRDAQGRTVFSDQRCDAAAQPVEPRRLQPNLLESVPSAAGTAAPEVAAPATLSASPYETRLRYDALERVVRALAASSGAGGRGERLFAAVRHNRALALAATAQSVDRRQINQRYDGLAHDLAQRYRRDAPDVLAARLVVLEADRDAELLGVARKSQQRPAADSGWSRRGKRRIEIDHCAADRCWDRMARSYERDADDVYLGPSGICRRSGRYLYC